jgi:hypothetical protein
MDGDARAHLGDPAGVLRLIGEQRVITSDTVHECKRQPDVGGEDWSSLLPASAVRPS